jgi:hypothetical protein
MMEEEEEEEEEEEDNDTEEIKEEEEFPFGRFATPKQASTTTSSSSSNTPGLSRLMEGLKTTSTTTTTTVPDFKFPKNTTTSVVPREVFTTAPDSKGRVQTYYEVPKAQRIQFTNPKSTAVHAFDIKTPSGRMAPLILFKDEGIDAVITTMVSQNLPPTSKENPIVLEEE